MKYRYIDTVKKHLYITSHEPAFHYSVLEVPAQHRSTPLLQRNIIILHSRAARSGDDHSCPAFAFSYFRARFRVFALSRFRVFAFSLPVFAFSRGNATHHRGRDTHTFPAQSSLDVIYFNKHGDLKKKKRGFTY